MNKIDKPIIDVKKLKEEKLKVIQSNKIVKK